MKILVVDDDSELLGLIRFALEQTGYLVVSASTGQAALAVAQNDQPDLIILDVNLPGLSGFEVCQRIRAESTTPILMLTVRSGEEDLVRGLDLGADEYLTKPFSPRTLLAHVRALLRRAGNEQPVTLETGDIRLSLDDQTATVREGKPVRLTNREFRLLHYLVTNAGRTLTSERLLSHVWGYESAEERPLLKQVVHRIRQKIERDPAEPRYLLTVPTIGYTLRPTPEDEAH